MAKFEKSTNAFKIKFTSLFLDKTLSHILPIILHSMTPWCQQNIGNIVLVSRIVSVVNFYKFE
jgi:hypothetical protein